MRIRHVVTLLLQSALMWCSCAGGHAGQDHYVPEVAEHAVYQRASWDQRRRLDPALGDAPPNQPFCKVKMTDQDRDVMGLVHAEYEASRRHSRELAPGDIEIPVYFHGMLSNGTMNTEIQSSQPDSLQSPFSRLFQSSSRIQPTAVWMTLMPTSSWPLSTTALAAQDSTLPWRENLLFT